MEATYRAVVAAAVVALLTGCAAQTDNHADTVLSTLNGAQQSLNTCVSDTYNDPQFEPLGTHMPMNIRGVSMEQLTDEHFATDDEITMLMAYEESAQACRKAYLDELRPVAPTVELLTAAAYARNQGDLQDLMKKRLSWGGYIRGVVGTYRDLNSKVEAELRRIANKPLPDSRTQ